MALAHVASMRSEDPFRKVGAVALDFSNRVIATAYNGLPSGFKAPPGFWNDRDKRQKYMLHAEVNLCSLFRKGDVRTVAITTLPCSSCMTMLCAYEIREIYYNEDYASDAFEVASMYGVILTKVQLDTTTYPVPKPWTPDNALPSQAQEERVAAVLENPAYLRPRDNLDPKLKSLLDSPAKKTCSVCGMFMTGETCTECAI